MLSLQGITYRIGARTLLDNVSVNIPAGRRVGLVGPNGTAEQDGDVVNLSANNGSGETNLIIRARDDDGKTKIYQYRVTVQTP